MRAGRYLVELAGAEITVADGHDSETPSQRQFAPLRVQLRKTLSAHSDAKLRIRFYLPGLRRTEPMRDGARRRCIRMLVHDEHHAGAHARAGDRKPRLLLRCMPAKTRTEKQRAPRRLTGP
jgi:hypothetical protein